MRCAAGCRRHWRGGPREVAHLLFETTHECLQRLGPPCLFRLLGNSFAGNLIRRDNAAPELIDRASHYVDLIAAPQVRNRGIGFMRRKPAHRGTHCDYRRGDGRNHHPSAAQGQGQARAECDQNPTACGMSERFTTCRVLAAPLHVQVDGSAQCVAKLVHRLQHAAVQQARLDFRLDLAGHRDQLAAELRISGPGCDQFAGEVELLGSAAVGV